MYQEFAPTVKTEARSISVMSDSSIAIAYINNKGGIKSKECIEIAKEKIILYKIILKLILSSLRHTYQENTILRQTSFLENLTVIQNGNLILRYLLKLRISLTTQKTFFATRTNSILCFLVL